MAWGAGGLCVFWVGAFLWYFGYLFEGTRAWGVVFSRWTHFGVGLGASWRPGREEEFEFSGVGAFWIFLGALWRPGGLKGLSFWALWFNRPGLENLPFKEVKTVPGLGSTCAPHGFLSTITDSHRL